MKEGIPTDKQSSKEKKSKSSTPFASVKSVIAGDVLTSEKLDKHVGYMLFIVALVILYIGNGYHAYTLEKENKTINKEIKELQAEFISTQAVLIEKMKLTNIKTQIEVQLIDIKELQTPPYTISTNGH